MAVLVNGVRVQESNKIPQTAAEIRAIKPELSQADQDRYDRIMLYIIDEQKKGNTEWTDGNRLLFGYPQLWNKLKENGFEVWFDNGRRLWSKNVPSFFTVSWENKSREEYIYDMV